MSQDSDEHRGQKKERDTLVDIAAEGTPPAGEPPADVSPEPEQQAAHDAEPEQDPRPGTARLEMPDEPDAEASAEVPDPETPDDAPEAPAPLEQEPERGIYTSTIAIDETPAADEPPPDGATVLIDVGELDGPGPGAVPRVAHLSCFAGNDVGRVFRLGESTVLLGRGMSCGIVLNDPTVSRRHFNIMRTTGGYRLVDLGSGNGTRVDGEVVPEAPLEEGTVIEVGITKLRFGLGEPPPSEELVAAADAHQAMATPEPEAASGADESPVAAPETARRRSWLWPLVAIVVVLLAAVFLLTDKLAGWGIVFPGKTGPPSPAVQAQAQAAVADELFEAAKEQIAAEEWSAAVMLLEQAYSADQERGDIRKQLFRARAERDAREDFQTALTAVSMGNPAAAQAAINRIPDTSAYYDKARELAEGLAKAPVKRLPVIVMKAADASSSDTATGDVAAPPAGASPDALGAGEAATRADEAIAALEAKEFPRARAALAAAAPNRAFVLANKQVFVARADGLLAGAREAMRNAEFSVAKRAFEILVAVLPGEDPRARESAGFLAGLAEQPTEL